MPNQEPEKKIPIRDEFYELARERAAENALTRHIHATQEDVEQEAAELRANARGGK